MTISVLMFCPQFRPVVGGAERQAEKLARALAVDGMRVNILTPRLDALSPDMEETDGVHIERFPLIDLSRRYPCPGVALANIPAIAWQVAKALRPRLHEADVLHCHVASLATTVACWTGVRAGIPTLCKAAMADDRSDLGEIEKTGATGPFVARMARQFIGTWVATTVAVEEALVRAGVQPGRIVRIPNGVEAGRKSGRRASRPSVSRFLYLGRLSTNTQRDVPTVISAFDRLASTYAGIELAIVGGGDLLEATRQLAEKSPARARIHVPGFSEADRWLAWADCFVLPSRREGLSNALLEALAEGLPCIANDIPPNREVLDGGKAGMLVPVEDVSALESAMHRLVLDPKQSARLSVAATDRVARHYSIETVAARYRELYIHLQSRDSAVL